MGFFKISTVNFSLEGTFIFFSLEGQHVYRAPIHAISFLLLMSHFYISACQL
jgi:hypothetical protein